MRTRLTLHPDQDGAKQLRDRYGERLVCVRYRYDETKKQRWKTVELIIEKWDWEPPMPRQPEDAVVAIQVAAQEREVRKQVKAVGGKWNPREVVWELSYGQVVDFSNSHFDLSRPRVGRNKRSVSGFMSAGNGLRPYPGLLHWLISLHNENCWVDLGLTARIVTKGDEREREAHLRIEGADRAHPSTDR